MTTKGQVKLTMRDGREVTATTAELERLLGAAPGRPLCECGCGGVPAGKRSRFLPGHDAKLASAERKRAEEVATTASASRNTPDRPRRPSRRRSGKDGATETGGSEA